MGNEAGAIIEKLIADTGGWRGERLAEIRAIIFEAAPDVLEELKWQKPTNPVGTPVWSKHGMFANANAFKDKVKLTFLHGAHLKDPKKLFNNGLEGNKWRAIDMKQGHKLNKPALKALFKEAIAYNKANNVPKSKGGGT
ncbi:MAG: DUF1801 domain-containing protein [Planctomycetes bacterium]|nr:DUF1801 domain-containing protein [Planctomycetota bacterium]